MYLTEFDFNNYDGLLKVTQLFGQSTEILNLDNGLGSHRLPSTLHLTSVFVISLTHLRRRWLT